MGTQTCESSGLPWLIRSMGRDGMRYQNPTGRFLDSICQLDIGGKNLGIKRDHSFPLLMFYLHLVLPKQVKCKHVREKKLWETVIELGVI